MSICNQNNNISKQNSNKTSSNPFREKHTKYSTYINNNKHNPSTTLDNKHQEKINEFNNQDTLLKKKNKKLKLYIKELDELEHILLKDLSTTIIDKKANIKNEIENLELEINQLKNRFQELDYYDETMDILLEYYNPNTKNKQQQETVVVNINDLFKKKDIISTNTDKSKLYDKYMKIVHNVNTRKIKNSHMIKICSKCKIEKTIHANDGYLICTSCGDSEPILLETDKPSFKDSNIESKACAYKRANHLSEILNQFQAKESTEIDQEIYIKIKDELRVQRIYDYKILDHKIIKKILKKLKLNKYYEHSHHIINNLNGIPPPTMTREQEENIKKTFKDIQKPFALFRPKKRKNFLNYNYIIHKICELYEYDEFLPHFPLLKSRINLEDQDLVWEKICNYRGYQFIPSI
jgi:hypothetical protein